MPLQHPGGTIPAPPPPSIPNVFVNPNTATAMPLPPAPVTVAKVHKDGWMDTVWMGADAYTHTPNQIFSLAVADGGITAPGIFSIAWKSQTSDEILGSIITVYAKVAGLCFHEGLPDTEEKPEAVSLVSWPPKKLRRSP